MAKRKEPKKTKQQVNLIISNANVVAACTKEEEDREFDQATMKDLCIAIDCTITHLDILQKRLVATQKAARTLDPCHWPSISHVEHLHDIVVVLCNM